MRPYTSLRDIPGEAFPLFVTTKQWLLLLDATTPQPFHERAPDGRLRAEGEEDEGMEADPEGIGLQVCG